MGSGQSVIITPIISISNNDTTIEDINIEDNPNSYDTVSGNKFDVDTTEYFIKKKDKYVSIGKYTGETVENIGQLQGFGTFRDTLYIFKDKSNKIYKWNSSTIEMTPETIYYIPSIAIVLKSGDNKTRKKIHKNT
jgi:hypothetical protein